MKLHSPPHISRTAGFALVDVSISLLILVLAMGALLGTVFSALRLSQTTEDTAAANQATRGIVESLATVPFEQVFAAFNADPDDDPDPGRDYRASVRVPAHFDANEGEVAAASIDFPVIEGLNGLELREDLVDPALGMPCDLNGDGEIDGLDHSGDYRILPVSVRLEWHGPGGRQRFSFSTVLGPR